MTWDVYKKTLIKRFLEDNFISYIMLSLEDLRNFKHQLMGHMERSSYLIPLQEICGYQLSCVKMVGTFFLVLITFGLTLVLITWRKDIKVGQRDRQINWNWFEIGLTLMHSVRTALSRGQVGRGREGLTHRPSSSTSARRVGHQVVRETIPLFLDVAIPCSDYNLSCSSSTRRTSMCGTKPCNSSESSATSTRASTNQISSKCR